MAGTLESRAGTGQTMRVQPDHPLAAPLAPVLELPAPPEIVIEALSPLITPRRLARIEAIVAARTRSVVAVLDGLIDPHNIAAVLRSADAFGTQEVHLVRGQVDFAASRRVTQGSDRWLDLVVHDDAAAAVAALRARGHRVYVAAMDGELTPAGLARIERLAVVFGNEHAGVSPEARAAADGTYTIPMVGFAQSLNVSVAAAITLRAAMDGRAGDLTDDDRQRLRARFMLLSVERAECVVAEHQRRRSR